jgi:hypothetical protein
MFAKLMGEVPGSASTARSCGTLDEADLNITCDIVDVGCR